MSNINSYIASKKERIGLFSPYNELDALVFARVSYLPLHKIRLKKNETVGSICRKLSEKLERKDYAWPDDYDYVEALKNTPRFSKKKVTNYVRRNSTSLEKQFSALTIHLSPLKMYVSFFGTDDSLTGWKEDFNLAFLDHIPAQTEAKKYFKKVSKKYFLKKVYLGGHSKGGNLAIYAAIVSPDALQKRIKKVYNYDGPGLRKGTMALDTGSEKVTKKIQSIIPQGSVIGRLFEHNEEIKVVKSNAKRLYQHDIYTWEISGDSFVESKNTKRSDIVDKTITTWLERASKAERKVFINVIFEALSDADVNNPLELKSKWLRVMQVGLKTYVNLPKEDRKTIFEVWKKLGSSFMKARKE
ncbi:DUF2974 domain-containing protein [Candidatus Saccharibacteria bacterium]|nr:DUF2974 domain-containing protein [Candidatus Saccharibacteria bacterium]